MKRFVKDQGIYSDIIKKLKEKFDTLSHIFPEEILILIDSEFEVKPPKAKKGEEEPSQEAIDKWNDKKRKAWKFQLKTIPQLYQDALDTRKQFVLIGRQSLLNELSQEQIIAFIYSELRKINHEYKLQKPDLNTFSDLAKLLGRPDWDQAFNIPNLLDE